MAIKSRNELLQKLELGDFAIILGTAECVWLDFKQAGYQTIPGKSKLSEHGRHELCKDVSAFANKDGGIILVGYRERREPGSGMSVADKLTPIKANAIDTAHYRHVLMADIYPVVDEIAMNWYGTATDEGVLAIIVPKRTAGRHIVRNVHAEDERHLPGIAIYERMGDQNLRLSC